MSGIGYHISKIEKGVLGERSKVVEEFKEWEDSCQQDCVVMELVELSDLLGAIESYTESKYNISLEDLQRMNKITKRAFINGRR